MVFGVGDFAMIETCVLLALAGQHDKCALISTGADVYRDMAASIYGLDRAGFLAIPEEELSLEQSEQRRVGKNTVLGCGYQMGPERFRLQYLRHLPKTAATELAERVVYTHYRKSWAPMVPKLWRDLERTARRAMFSPGTIATAGCGIGYRLETIGGIPCLVCRLLNGKHIHYQNARISSDRVHYWGFPAWTYWAYRKGQWREIEPYGGQLVENAVQALARELLVDAMFRLEDQDYPVVLTVHDEIVVEHSDITKETIEEIMSIRPQWAERPGENAIAGVLAKIEREQVACDAWRRTRLDRQREERQQSDQIGEFGIGKAAGLVAIQRGSMQSIRAVLYYADLAGFTRFAETNTGLALVATLNHYLVWRSHHSGGWGASPPGSAQASAAHW
jgi:hypothetical protein